MGQKSTTSRKTVSTKGLSKALLGWYDQNARELPWRVGPGRVGPGRNSSASQANHTLENNPYHVWLSEIMLQQTTVATVGPRFREFLDRWPTVEDMANAERDDILGAWAGLGYYARARNLHRCAQVIVAEHGGNFPRTLDSLRALPGVGEYTAAAIMAIAFDQKAIVMDGNIERITARISCEKTPLPKAKPVLKEHLSKFWPTKRHGDFAQAMMDLAAQICRPKSPDCSQCPIARYCCAHHSADSKFPPDYYPVKLPKKTKPTRYGDAFVLLDKDGLVAFERRPEKGLLGGMLGLPGNQWSEKAKAQPDATALALFAPIKAGWTYAGIARHTFTHFHLEMRVYRAKTKTTSKKFIWHSPTQVNLPTVMKKGLHVGLDGEA